jgi:molybdopterin converting factor small subunit
MPTVHVPTILRKFSSGKADIQVKANTVAEAFDSLEAACPGIRNQILDSQGALLKHVKVFLNEDDVGFEDWKRMELRDRDKVLIITAMAGG